MKSAIREYSSSFTPGFKAIAFDSTSKIPARISGFTCKGTENARAFRLWMDQDAEMFSRLGVLLAE
ncbi:hypothetical protein DRN70_04000 [Methanosarcinales archaeon]|nr:MAG: hypothetical protein DRN70_04000 [Methanosarcinales archaeon]